MESHYCRLDSKRYLYSTLNIEQMGYSKNVTCTSRASECSYRAFFVMSLIFLSSTPNRSLRYLQNPPSSDDTNGWKNNNANKMWQTHCQQKTKKCQTHHYKLFWLGTDIDDALCLCIKFVLEKQIITCTERHS